ncbi:MAG: DUF1003 domain-containing protein [Flavobacteriales bacterium]|nr:DUF1003 domain-containing protein [Flavobacteriales bacterium]
MEIRNSNHIYQNLLNKSEKFAVWITEKVGSMGFFLLIFFWTVGWLSWNILAPQELRFDPYPAFVLWLFISNMIQIFLMPLIMIGQNLQGKHAEIRAENDYQVNLKAEKEIAEIKQELANLKKLLEENVLKKS